MKFGVFYEHQLPKPWHEGDEARLYREAPELRSEIRSQITGTLDNAK